MSNHLKLLVITLTVASLSATPRGAPPLSILGGHYGFQVPRVGRTLINTFPFNTNLRQDVDHQAHAHHAHHDESADHEDHQPHEKHTHENDAQISRQGAANEPSQENALNIGEIADAGERCIEKVMMVEELVYDEQIECHHSYDQRCHTTYTTDYEPQQEEECDDNFIKNCYIEYKTVAFDEPVKICNENLIRNCDKPGPEVCETVYESECETSYHEHELEEDVPACRTMQVEKCRDVTVGYTTEQQCDKWPKQVCELESKTVKKYSPETQCRKTPRTVCGPGPCPIEAGPEECREEKKTVVQEIPQENCDLTPQKVCKHVTKLIPVLKPKQNCVDIPKEVCTRARRNPRKINKPVIKKWCYTPSEETGLGDFNPNGGSADNNNPNGIADTGTSEPGPQSPPTTPAPVPEDPNDETTPTPASS